MAIRARKKPKDYDSRVFINCPFDNEFKPIFDAIIFAVHDLGFLARHALIDDGTVIRLERIASEIATSLYSIHDLSRIQLGVNGLPRLNMSFECGVAYAVHAMKPYRCEHHIAVFDTKPYQYQASTSDLAGLDVKAHGNDPIKAIECVRSFLKRKSGDDKLPGATHVVNRYRAFQSMLKSSSAVVPSKVNLAELNSLDYVNDLQALMADWI